MVEPMSTRPEINSIAEYDVVLAQIYEVLK